jgi:protein TonB
VCLLCGWAPRPLWAADKDKDANQVKSNQETAGNSQEKIYDIGGDVLPPKLIHVVEPQFNPKSEEVYVSGTIKIQIIITKDGGVKDPKVLAGKNERQDKAATDAVLQWRFKPALRGSEPVSVRATVEVNFHLL